MSFETWFSEFKLSYPDIPNSEWESGMKDLLRVGWEAAVKNASAQEYIKLSKSLS